MDSTRSVALPLDSTDVERLARYDEVKNHLALLLDGETDAVAIMATVVCELHHALSYYDWTGFYRNVDEALIIGPYQGGHGCLHIAFDRGVCGAAARTKTTQLVPDVHAFPGHIACSSTTRSEVVVPWIDAHGTLLGVLDVDSDAPAAFRDVDAKALESLLKHLSSAQ